MPLGGWWDTVPGGYPQMPFDLAPQPAYVPEEFFEWLASISPEDAAPFEIESVEGEG